MTEVHHMILVDRGTTILNILVGIREMVLQMKPGTDMVNMIAGRTEDNLIETRRKFILGKLVSRKIGAMTGVITRVMANLDMMLIDTVTRVIKIMTIGRIKIMGMKTSALSTGLIPALFLKYTKHLLLD